MNKVYDFLCSFGFKLMLVGFGIIATTVFVSIVIMQKGGAKYPLVWWIIGLGAVVYVAGRAGVAMQRNRIRKQRYKEDVVFEPHEDQRPS
jgi:hypothetical protein